MCGCACGWCGARTAELPVVTHSRPVTVARGVASLLVHSPAPTEDGRGDTLSLALCIGLALLIDMMEFVPLTSAGCCAASDDSDPPPPTH